jgi:hypothetical protein
MREYSGTTFAAADAYLRQSNGGHGMDGRKIGNNTRLERRGADSIAVRLHGTDVVTYHNNRTATLSTGGWRTVTTIQRINAYGPARVFSDRGHLCIWHHSDPNTPARVQSCRSCKGTGRVDGWERTETGYQTVPNGRDCYRCGGRRTRDYGSKSDPRVWGAGPITVTEDGEVCHPNGDRIVNPGTVARLSEQLAQDREARKVREAAAAAWAAGRAERQANAIHVGDGTTVFYKGVNGQLKSPIRRYGGLDYAPRTLVDAGEVDLDPDQECGRGVNFVRTMREAEGYGSHVVSLTVPPNVPYVDAGAKLRAQCVMVLEVVSAP